MKLEPTICAVIGYPLKHSLSPLIHNAAFSKLGLNYMYKSIEIQDTKAATRKMLEENIKGYSVTIPHKESIIQQLNEVEPIAEKIGAINTVINENRVLKGYNTDYSAAIKSIEDVIDIKNKRAAILGAGGAARAIAYGLKLAAVSTIIQNRTIEKAKVLAEELNCDFSEINSELLKDCDLIINTTSVGMYPDIDNSIIENIPENCTVCDIVYNPLETKFLKIARRKGCKIINGKGMFLYQAVEQFKLFTGKEAPKEIMEKVLLEGLK